MLGFLVLEFQQQLFNKIDSTGSSEFCIEIVRLCLFFQSFAKDLIRCRYYHYVLSSVLLNSGFLSISNSKLLRFVTFRVFEFETTQISLHFFTGQGFVHFFPYPAIVEKCGTHLTTVKNPPAKPVVLLWMTANGLRPHRGRS